jgi:hypothetical protein
MEASTSQQGSTEDSQLQTDQPDQPIETRPVAAAAAPVEAPYGTVPADQTERDAQLDADRQSHNERTGGGDVVPGERQAQIDEHNARTGDNAGYVTDDARLDQSGNEVSAPQGFGQQGGLGQRPQAQQGVQPVSATDAPQGPSTQPPAENPPAETPAQG